jgi:hypothetical protein
VQRRLRELPLKDWGVLPPRAEDVPARIWGKLTAGLAGDAAYQSLSGRYPPSS